MEGDRRQELEITRGEERQIVDIVDNGETAPGPDIMSIPTEWTQINIVNRKLSSSMQIINFTQFKVDCLRKVF